jgi:hypothetical protein
LTNESVFILSFTIMLALSYKILLSPPAGDWRRETGDWRRETGDWRPETGGWRPETGGIIKKLTNVC